jgi:hypothetical protein
MDLAGKYRQEVAYPQQLAPGKYADQYSLNENVIERYNAGDHLIWGGPKVGMFWASDATNLASLQPKPVEHAIETLKQANKELMK